LVQLKSRDVQISPIWKGEATLDMFDHPYLELVDLNLTSTILDAMKGGVRKQGKDWLLEI